MKAWVLVIALIGDCRHMVEFDTEQACNSALVRVLKEAEVKPLLAFCTPTINTEPRRP